MNLADPLRALLAGLITCLAVSCTTMAASSTHEAWPVDAIPVTSETWAVPNGAYTNPLLHWASTKFNVIWLEGHMPGHALADNYHVRYRAEIANGPMQSLSHFKSALHSPMYNRTW